MEPFPPTANQSITPQSYRLTEEHRPQIGGMDVLDLAKTYGTPLYVMDGETVRAMAQAYRAPLQEQYPAASLVLYACKANMNLGLVKLAQQAGLGLDVVSGGELYTALQAGFPVEKIFFNGNNKTLDEVELAIHHRIGRITVDNFHELALIHQVASHKGGGPVEVLLRIAPGIDCHTHDYIKTGHLDSKFGFDLSYLSRAIDLITTEYRDTIVLKGLHAHVGSQIFEIKPYEDLVELMLNVFYNIQHAYEGLTLSDLNIGGGMGVAYGPGDDPPQVSQAVARIVNKVTAYATQLNYPLPRLVLEPGRSLVATAGVTLYTVGSVKDVPGIRKYVAVDGGMGDNIRPALYQAEYTAVVANKLDSAQFAETETVTIAGKYCESGDVLIKNLQVPLIEANDTLMVFGTGAYNYAMASHYNRVPKPAMVLVENGDASLLVRRETYESLLQHDVVPAHLRNSEVSPPPAGAASAPLG